jgi:hypothetical protein
MKRHYPREKRSTCTSTFFHLNSHRNSVSHQMFVSPPAIMFDSELSPMLPLTLTAACRQEQELAHSSDPVAKQRSTVLRFAVQFGPINGVQCYQRWALV